jgi:hypothetical protein
MDELVLGRVERPNFRSGHSDSWPNSPCRRSAAARFDLIGVRVHTRVSDQPNENSKAQKTDDRIVHKF